MYKCNSNGMALFGRIIGLWVILLSNIVWADTELKLPLPKAKGNYSETQQCVEPIDAIRRFHGSLLKRQRDKTMHHGIRTESDGKPAKHSLIGCIDCHITPDAQGQYPDIHTPQHFCNSCHTYAAVQVDCFQCHATKPGEALVKPVAVEVTPIPDEPEPQDEVTEVPPATPAETPESPANNNQDATATPATATPGAQQ